LKIGLFVGFNCHLQTLRKVRYSRDPRQAIASPSWATSNRRRQWLFAELREPGKVVEKVKTDVFMKPENKGRFYHDGRFQTLLDVVTSHNSRFYLELTPQESQDLVEYLKSL
jgi:hypothetical protein